MTKQDLIRELSDNIDISVADAFSAVTSIVEIMSNTLQQGESIYLRGLGTLKVVTSKPKKARNISTGETVMIPERKRVKFIPSKLVK
jgi:nucleoid DNA-binding protein